MKKFVLAITYEPKIAAVLHGSCRQTIRRGDRFSEGDEVLFHGWEGTPYRTPWSWRKRVELVDVEDVIIDDVRGVQLCGIWHGWGSDNVRTLAVLDHINPPTGTGLREALNTLGSGMNYERHQIIRW